MSNQNDETERLTRLRDRQIQARDPHAKGKATHAKLAARGRRIRKEVTLLGMLEDVLTNIPSKWQFTVVGVTLGLVVSVVLTVAVEEYWAALAGLGITVVLAMAGFIIGRAFDWRDEVRDEL